MLPGVERKQSKERHSGSLCVEQVPPLGACRLIDKRNGKNSKNGLIWITFFCTYKKGLQYFAEFGFLKSAGRLAGSPEGSLFWSEMEENAYTYANCDHFGGPGWPARPGG